jgi:uncharacterized protein YndB with AHSA1/START domain
MTRILFAVLIAAGLASAEVVVASDPGFTLKTSAIVAATPDKVYASLIDVAKWWDPAHTYSGSSQNMSINPTGGGCFCEKLPDGGVQHMTVVFASKGKMLRMTGGLGPLQASAVVGVLTFEMAKVDTGTRLTMTYTAAGVLASGSLGDMAPLVDGVLGVQFGRLKAFAEKAE